MRICSLKYLKNGFVVEMKLEATILFHEGGSYHIETSPLNLKRKLSI